jgi:organic hydroperoxide reductase OsmC/OhrA
VPVPLSDPAGVDPEEAVVAAASSCHMLWFLDLARRAGFVIESYRDEAVGELGRDDRGRISLLVIRLRPVIIFTGTPPDPGTLARLHDEAHEACFIANSLRAKVVIETPT